MHIGVPAETVAGETRVAATPETVKKIIAQGHTVAVQSGAGVAASITDAAFEAAGLTVSGRTEVRPHHPKVNDKSDALHEARAGEVTSLWRLKPL